jgi:pimeloyl-ACP methyl ester carboxylesterase
MYYLSRKMNGYNITVGIFSLIIIVTSLGIITTSINYFDINTIHFAYGQASQTNSNSDSNNTNTNSLDVQKISAKKVHVGDIDIAYKVFGKGEPIILIGGVPLVMDAWPQSLLQELSSDHMVIIFDNRGVGNTTSGTEPFSIEQFANDTSGLLSALRIHKADVVGFSVGSLIAQELTLMHPAMVNRLVLYASECGGKESISPSPQAGQEILSNPQALSSVIKNPSQTANAFLPLLFPQKFIEENPSFISKFLTMFQTLKEIDPPAAIVRQLQALGNWAGSCSQLSKISIPLLVITGTEDAAVPAANSLIIVQKIPGSWLVQIKGAGHGLMYQYPETFNKVLQTFLTTTTITSS